MGWMSDRIEAEDQAEERAAANAGRDPWWTKMRKEFKNTRQVCKNAPSCFGDIGYEEKENDCHNCPFKLLCAKTFDKGQLVKELEKKLAFICKVDTEGLLKKMIDNHAMPVYFEGEMLYLLRAKQETINGLN